MTYYYVVSRGNHMWFAESVTYSLTTGMATITEVNNAALFRFSNYTSNRESDVPISALTYVKKFDSLAELVAFTRVNWQTLTIP